jgi:hypothetical protein
MAASDARPIPRKNTAYRVYFPLLDADGDLVTGATGLDSEVSLDGASFADCTNEATEIGSSGMYYLDLTSSEMNADAVVLIVKHSTSGGKTTPITLYPEELGDIRVDVGMISGDSAAADNAEAAFDGGSYNVGGGGVVAASVTGNVGGNVTGSVGSLAAQAKADVNAEVDSALDTAIPGSPTANSINERVKAIDDKLPSGNIGDATAANQTTIQGYVDALETRLTEARAGYLDNLSGGAVALDADIQTIIGYVDELETRLPGSFSELGSVPGATPTLVQLLMFLYMQARNKITQTADTATFHNSAGSAIGTAATSDDGTTFERAKYA